MKRFHHEYDEHHLHCDTHDQALGGCLVKAPGNCQHGMRKPVEFAKHPARHAPVRHLRCEEPVAFDILEIVKLFLKIVQQPARPRHSYAGDGCHRNERHLETGVFQGQRIDGEQHKRTQCDCVQRRVIAVQNLAGDQDGHHHRGAHDRRLSADKQRIAEDRDRDDCQPYTAPPEKIPGSHSRRAGNHGQVEPGDDDHVVKPAGLEVAFDGGCEFVLLPENHAQHEPARVAVVGEEP